MAFSIQVMVCSIVDSTNDYIYEIKNKLDKYVLGVK